MQSLHSPWHELAGALRAARCALRKHCFFNSFIGSSCGELAAGSIEMEIDATSPVIAAEAVRAGFTESRPLP